MATEPVTMIQIPDRPTTEFTQLVARTGIAVDSLSINSEDEYASAGDLLKLVAERRNAAYEFLSDDIALAHKLHLGLTKKRAVLIAPWDAFRAKVESVMKKFRLGQQAQLDSQRREQERRANELTRAAEQQSEELKARGNFAEARQIVQQAETVVAHGSQMIPEKEKVSGIRESEPYSGVCEDPIALMRAIVAGDIPLMHTVKVRGEEQEEPVFVFNKRIGDMMAKRLRGDWAWPGCRSERGISFGVSKR